MKKSFTILAVALCSTLAMAQTNQYFWANGQFIMGNPIDQVDSITFGQIDDTDSIMLYFPHTVKVIHDTIIQKEYVYDTIYIHDCDTNDNWNGFIVKAIEDNTVIHYGYIVETSYLNPDPSKIYDCTTIEGSLYYSYDAEMWKEWYCMDSIVLQKGQKVYLKGSRPYYGILNKLYFCLNIKNGAAQGYGYINSLFENSDEYTQTSIPEVALTHFFQGKCKVSLSIPEGVANLGTTNLYSYTFAGNGHVIEEDSYGITEISLPSTLQTISGTCFESAQITELTIPRSVTYIGDAAFNGCTRLSTVNYLGTIAEWNAITKGNYKWTSPANIPANTIHCTDGDAPF